MPASSRASQAFMHHMWCAQSSSDMNLPAVPAVPACKPKAPDDVSVSAERPVRVRGKVVCSLVRGVTVCMSCSNYSSLAAAYILRSAPAAPTKYLQSRMFGCISHKLACSVLIIG